MFCNGWYDYVYCLKWVLYMIATDPGTITAIQGSSCPFRNLVHFNGAIYCRAGCNSCKMNLYWPKYMWSCGTGTICSKEVANNECRLAKFNKYPKYKSQLLAKTCLGIAQQVGTKNGGSSSKNKQNSTMLLFSSFPEKPPGLVGIKISYFFQLFFYIFLRIDVTQAPTTKILYLKQRWDVAYKKSGAFPENWKTSSEPQNCLFLIFLKF